MEGARAVKVGRPSLSSQTSACPLPTTRRGLVAQNSSTTCPPTTAEIGIGTGIGTTSVDLTRPKTAITARAGTTSGRASALDATTTTTTAAGIATGSRAAGITTGIVGTTATGIAAVTRSARAGRTRRRSEQSVSLVSSRARLTTVLQAQQTQGNVYRTSSSQGRA